jgi:ABC-type phosphate/phosphonate transport system substrate-binding protein
MSAMRKVTHVWFALCCLLMVGNAWAAQVVRIGVLSFQSKPDTLAQWLPTADLLTQQLPQNRFEVLPLSYDELNTAVANASIDFVLTNPEHYVVLRNQLRLRPMVTLNRVINGQVVDQFGSVIFTRADSSIMQLEDVRGKRLAAVDINSLGGFLMAADQFHRHGIELTSDKRVTLSFVGVPPSQVVQEVLNGQADAVVVRTGILEQMRAQGQLQLSQ